jgi:hypothetical protein
MSRNSAYLYILPAVLYVRHKPVRHQRHQKYTQRKHHLYAYIIHVCMYVYTVKELTNIHQEYYDDHSRMFLRGTTVATMARQASKTTRLPTRENSWHQQPMISLRGQF